MMLQRLAVVRRLAAVRGLAAMRGAASVVVWAPPHLQACACGGCSNERLMPADVLERIRRSALSAATSGVWPWPCGGRCLFFGWPLCVLSLCLYALVHGCGTVDRVWGAAVLVVALPLPFGMSSQRLPLAVAWSRSALVLLVVVPQLSS